MIRTPALPGALVLSLDFELHWGLFEKHSTATVGRRILGARLAIPRILRLFRENDIAGTWATVGFLFARTAAERKRFEPSVRPKYPDPRMDPYRVSVGADERSDPYHYAASLIDRIRDARQEIGTHTYSHFYCREEWQDASAFEADIMSAIGIARQFNVTFRSIVFPSNQHNPAYDHILLKHGIQCFRGNRATWLLPESDAARQDTWSRRAGRLANSYINIDGEGLVDWHEVVRPSGLCDVAASAFLRPYNPKLRVLEAARRRRIIRSMRAAARERKIFHLWWHPHNFGCHIDENVAFLTALIAEYKRLESLYGMRSLSMAAVSEWARASGSASAA